MDLAPEPPAVPILTPSSLPRSNPRLRRLRPPAAVDSGVLTNWQERLGEILSSEDEDDLKAKDMLELIPRLPPDGQVEVAQRANQMLSDDDYRILAPYATNSALPEPVLDTLFAGVLGRPDSIRLPLLLSIAEDEQHPRSEDALTLLEGFLGQAYGTNWNQWSTTVDQRLNAASTNQNQEMTPTTPGE